MYLIFSHVTMSADVMAAKKVFAVAFPVIPVNPRTALIFFCGQCCKTVDKNERNVAKAQSFLRDTQLNQPEWESDTNADPPMRHVLSGQHRQCVTSWPAHLELIP